MSEGVPVPVSEASAWLEGAQKGDAEAYRRFLEWARRFVKTNALKHFRAWGMAKQEAIDDLIQDVLLAIHQKRHTYVPGRPVEAWLYSIVRYKAIDSLRGTIRDRRNISDQDMPEGWEAVDPSTSQAGSGAAVSVDAEMVLGTLSPRQREILVMAKLEGSSIEEISRRTGSSPGAVKVMVHRALKTLKKRFATDEGGPDEKD
jgi:RNA polymerase sigma-70 factor (ECF subfamily)